MSTITFDLNLFFKDSKNTLLNPNKYFSSMRSSGGFSEPLIKAVAYGILTGVVYLVCWFFRIRSFGAGYVGEAVGFLAFFKLIIVTVIGSGIGAAVLVMISLICRGNSNFEPSFRVTCSLMAVMPVYAVLSVSRAINFYFGLIVSIIFSLYFLWLFYYALTSALECRKRNVRAVLYGFTVLIILYVILNLEKISERKIPRQELTNHLVSRKELRSSDVKHKSFVFFLKSLL